jgi:hypothetical protein
MVEGSDASISVILAHLGQVTRIGAGIAARSRGQPTPGLPGQDFSPGEGYGAGAWGAAETRSPVKLPTTTLLLILTGRRR